MKIYKLNEARNKERFFKKHSKLTPEQKEELIKLYSEQYVPDDIIDWNKIESYSYDDLYNIVDTFIKNREEKKNKKNLSKAIEGRDYIKIFENKNREGTEYLYLPLTWLGSKYLASDHFLPKIMVPSEVMNASDFSDNSAKNEDLSPGAKWCISLWTLPDLVVNGEVVKDENGKELRHEGKRYWLGYTSPGGYYFLFYFRDYKGLDDIYKKIAITFSSLTHDFYSLTLADDTGRKITPDIEKVKEYWMEHYKEYESYIEHMQQVSQEDIPKFAEYERQKEKEAQKYAGYSILKEYLIYNEETGRYDSGGRYLSKGLLNYLITDGEFIAPLGVIDGNFDCSSLGLKTLKNGPTEVKGNFDCSRNPLTILEYSPKKVKGDFDCSECHLKSLKGSPKEIGGGFDCWNNQLTTLEGSPEYVGGWFTCSRNKLISLEGAPQKVRSFGCAQNELTSLKYAPKEAIVDFYCGGNKLTTLEYAPKIVVGDFDCSYNSLTALEYAPEYVGGSFNCYDNKLTTLEGAPMEVGGAFRCWNNPLQSKELSTEVKGRIYYDMW